MLLSKSQYCSCLTHVSEEIYAYAYSPKYERDRKREKERDQVPCSRRLISSYRFECDVRKLTSKYEKLGNVASFLKIFQNENRITYLP